MFFKNIDQAHFTPVFVPGGAQNLPTRRVFGVFSYLVLVTDSKVIIGVWIRRYAFGTRYASETDSNGKFFKIRRDFPYAVCPGRHYEYQGPRSSMEILSAVTTYF